MSLAKRRAHEAMEKRFELQKDCCHFVCHLFVPDGPDLVKSHASGVLIRYAENHYLLTAAHVVDGYDINHICIPRFNKSTFVTLGGKWHRLDPEIDRDKDKIDLAFLQLDSESISILLEEGYSFLDEKNIGLNHELKNYSCYLILGFPASKSKYNKYTNNISEERFLYMTKPISSLDWLKNGDFDKDRNICLIRKEMGINQKTGQKCQMPDPRGISGGGLWFFDDINGTYSLIGIMIEYTKSLYVATKIDVFINAITEYNEKHSDIIHV